MNDRDATGVIVSESFCFLKNQTDHAGKVLEVDLSLFIHSIFLQGWTSCKKRRKMP